MKILGISGLPHCQTFKKRHFPYLEKRSYRIAQGFDSAAAVIINNKIIASAAQERFNREKSTEQFPNQAITFCLKQANLTVNDIDYIAHSFNYEPFKDYYKNDPFEQLRFNETYSQHCLKHSLQQLTYDFKKKFVPIRHHYAHAASTFYLCGMDEALILVTDGMGEVESMTIALGNRSGIEVLTQIPAIHSLGLFYSVFTLYLGFEFNQDEYKVMGLAPYGNKQRYFNEIMAMIHLKDNGTFTIPLLCQNFSLEEKENYAGSLKILIDKFGSARIPGSELTTKYIDIAAALQQALQNSLIHVLQYFKQKTGQHNLCMAGGVALNCTANSYIKKSKLFKNLFIQPASGDDGTALGAALYHSYSLNPSFTREKMSMPFWGPEFLNEEIKSIVHHHGLQTKEYSNYNHLARETAKRLAQGQIIAFFHGRMELGPRALGNRSILADPRHANMRDKINRIKKRENFRPFSPAVLAEKATQFFQIDEDEVSEYKYMTLITSVKDSYRNTLEAVTHVDGTARVQTVFNSECPKFWQVIYEFGIITSLPILLNTSFNIKGQPIVCTPMEAIQTFNMMELDCLVIENYLIDRVKIIEHAI